MTKKENTHLPDSRGLAASAAQKNQAELTQESAEDDVRRAINQHGAKAVKEATKKLTKGKPGRKREKDWPLLEPFLKQDVLDWLAGQDPVSVRSHHSIAVKYATAHPGYSPTSTVTRIRRKFKHKDTRRVFGLCWAMIEAREAHPHKIYLRLLQQLNDIHPKGPWISFLEGSESIIEMYTAIHGPPTNAESMSQIESKASKSVPVLETGLGRFLDGKKGK